MGQFDMDYIQSLLSEAGQEDTEGWWIETDSTAEWATSKVLAEVAERDRLIALADEQIKALQGKKRELADQCERRTSYLTGKLFEYFQGRKTRDTKTARTYQLLSGKLVLKSQQPEYVRDEATIIDWAEKTVSEYVRTEKRLDWAGLKKLTAISGEHVTYAETGEIIPGIVAEARPDVFEVRA